MVLISRLQAYLRHCAQQQYETISVPFFTIFFHPTNTLTYFNYAIPDKSCCDDLKASLSMVKNEFAAHGRCPRFEFMEEFAPQLAPTLRAAGFTEEARQQLMVCTSDTRRPTPEVLGLTIDHLSNSSTVSEMQEYITVQHRGFDFLSKEVVTESESEQFLRMMDGGRAYVARIKGESVGVGMYTAPFDGIAEVLGVATLEPFRRRGIATALTTLAVQRALEEGVEVICLTAADEHAGRVYERVGFIKYATMLAYIGSLHT
jgi:ribosomal protein S18 acetylase RimI-like enzyme